MEWLSSLYGTKNVRKRKFFGEVCVCVNFHELEVYICGLAE